MRKWLLTATVAVLLVALAVPATAGITMIGRLYASPIDGYAYSGTVPVLLNGKLAGLGNVYQPITPKGVRPGHARVVVAVDSEVGKALVRAYPSVPKIHGHLIVLDQAILPGVVDVSWGMVAVYSPAARDYQNVPVVVVYTHDTDAFSDVTDQLPASQTLP